MGGARPASGGAAHPAVLAPVAASRLCNSTASSMDDLLVNGTTQESRPLLLRLLHGRLPSSPACLLVSAFAARGTRAGQGRAGQKVAGWPKGPCGLFWRPLARHAMREQLSPSPCNAGFKYRIHKIKCTLPHADDAAPHN